MSLSHSISRRWKFGLLLTLITCFCWGILPITLMGVMHKIDPLTLTFYRFFLAVIVLLPFLLVRGTLGQLRTLRKPVVGKHVLWAGLLLTCNYGFYLLALERMSPTGAQVLIQLAPMLFLLSGIFLFKEPFTKFQWLGFFLFILGLILFFHLRLGAITNVLQSELPSSKTKDYAIGMILMVCASIAWAAYAIILKKVSSSMSSIHLMLVINIIGMLCFLPLSSPFLVMQLNAFEWLLLILCGLNTVFAYGSFSEALNHWEASRISAVLTIVPLLTMATIQVIKRYPIIEIEYEPLDSVVIIGAGVVILGAALTSLARKNSQ